MFNKIVYLKGGLGNQLFQYSFYRYLQKKGVNNIVLSDCIFLRDSLRKLELKSLSVDEGLITKNSFRRFYELLLFYLNLKIFKGSFALHDGEEFETEKLQSRFLYDGYWQDPKIVNEVLPGLNKEFVLNYEPCEGYFDFGNQVAENPNAIAIHVRRGDYYSNPLVKGSNILGIDYFKKAVETLCEERGINLSDAEVYFFSDDHKWVREAFAGNIEYKELGFKLTKPAEDLYLMSRFRNIIISNSTFSWWAAALGNPDKRVIIPPYWVEGVSSEERKLNSNWITIN